MPRATKFIVSDSDRSPLDGHFQFSAHRGKRLETLDADLLHQSVPCRRAIEVRLPFAKVQVWFVNRGERQFGDVIFDHPSAFEIE